MKAGLQKTRGSLDGVDTFLLVAERRSFSAAAQELGVSPSAVSQTIRALEDRVGVPLFMRTTRSVGLTQAGELFLEHAQPAISEINEAIEAARSLGERPAGRLRINLMRAVIQPIFEPILSGFCEAYPDSELEIFADDGFVDLTAGGFDAGVRLGESLAADMVAVRLTDPFRFAAVATPGYFDRYGRPQTPADLQKHRCVRMRLSGGGFADWPFMEGNRMVEYPVTGPIIVNDASAHMVAIRSGAAIGFVAEPMVEADVAAGRLEIVLSDHAASSGGLFLYYPHRRQIMPKLRAFIDYLKDNMVAVEAFYQAKYGL